MIGICALADELIESELTCQSLYQCAGRLVFDFVRKWECTNTRISKVNFRFNYHRIGKTKARRTFYALRHSDKGIVIHSGCSISDNYVYEKFICGESKNIIHIGPKTNRLLTNSIELPIDTLFHLAKPTQKTITLFVDNNQDFSLFSDIPYSVTRAERRMAECQFALVSNEENYIKALSYNCHPIVWSTINNASRIGFDPKAELVNYSDLHTRIVSKNSLINRLKISLGHRIKHVDRLRAELSEKLRPISDISAEVENKLFTFLRSE